MVRAWGSSWAESDERELEIPDHGGHSRFCLLSSQLSLAAPSLPGATNSSCENAPSQAGGENLSSWAGFTDPVHAELCSPLGSIGEFLSRCV